MAVDHVVLRDRDELQSPPDRVIVLHGLPSSRGEMPMVVFEACGYSEDMDSSTRSRLASFTLDLDVLVGAINAAFGDVVVLLDLTGLESVSA